MQNSNWPEEFVAILTKAKDSSWLKTSDWKRRCALCWLLTERIVLFKIMFACCQIKKAEVRILIRAAHDTLLWLHNVDVGGSQEQRNRRTEWPCYRLDENKSCPGFYSRVKTCLLAAGAKKIPIEPCDCLNLLCDKDRCLSLHCSHQQKTYHCVTDGKVQVLMRFYYFFLSVLVLWFGMFYWCHLSHYWWQLPSTMKTFFTENTQATLHRA